jgi:RimJ/RimL family protein N-acetyltransferase
MLDVFIAVAGEGRWILTEVPVDRNQRRDAWLETLQRTDARTFVAVVGDAIVGHLGAFSCRPGLLEFGMAVAADQRGKGIGSELLGACIAWGRDVGAHKILLEVFPTNHAARALYAKYGFVEEGYFRKHLRRANGELWDVIPMGLLLKDVAQRPG